MFVFKSRPQSEWRLFYENDEWSQGVGAIWLTGQITSGGVMFLLSRQRRLERSRGHHHSQERKFSYSHPVIVMIIPSSEVINPAPMVHQCWVPDFINRKVAAAEQPPIETSKEVKGKKEERVSALIETGQAVRNGELRPNVIFSNRGIHGQRR